ncbi:MAG: hypothetical protein ACLRPT_00955 [Akkermansia muciniphila]
MEHTPPLPSGFNINGYLIQSLKQTDSLCHVYYASDADHVQYLLREFCPQGLAVRDPESGKLRYPENTDIEREVLPLKNDFEAQFRTGSLGKSRSGHPVPGLCHSRRPCRRAAGSRHGRPAASRLQRDQRTLAAPGTAGAAPVHAGSLPSRGKEELRRHMDSHPAPAGRRMRNLLFHPEPCGKPVSAQEPDVPHSNRERRKPPNRKRKPPRPP